MVGSVIPVQRFTTMPGHFKHLTQKPTSRRWCKKSSVAKCSKRDVDEERWSIGVNKKRNHYEVLGVSVDSTSKEIKEAYRKLQKRYHPDIAGQKGHELSLMLNKAYKVLMREELRHDYDASIGQPRVSIGGKKSDLGYSSWNGPFRPEALFVDESACIGCRECIHHASNTFTMDEALGCARVKLQYGDDDTNIEVSVESCPVNCIHWVNRDDLPVLEFLTRPQPKNGHGIFGQGWERPKNVFMAVEAFKKQLQQEEEEEASYHHRNAQKTAEEETPAQAEARVNASMKLQMERFSGVWSWVNEILGH